MIFTGSIVSKITDEMVKIKNGVPRKETKIYLYSGHHSNLVTLLSAFGVYKFHIPQFSSAIMIELQSINNKYYVQVNYNLSSKNELSFSKISIFKTISKLSNFFKFSRFTISKFYICRYSIIWGFHLKLKF